MFLAQNLRIRARIRESREFQRNTRIPFHFKRGVSKRREFTRLELWRNLECHRITILMRHGYCARWKRTERDAKKTYWRNILAYNNCHAWNVLFLRRFSAERKCRIRTSAWNRVDTHIRRPSTHNKQLGRRQKAIRIVYGNRTGRTVFVISEVLQ